MLSSPCANWSPCLYYQWPGWATKVKRGKYVLSAPPQPPNCHPNYKVAFKKIVQLK